jgi:hypothetical protein
VTDSNVSIEVELEAEDQEEDAASRPAKGEVAPQQRRKCQISGISHRWDLCSAEYYLILSHLVLSFSIQCQEGLILSHLEPILKLFLSYPIVISTNLGGIRIYLKF